MKTKATIYKLPEDISLKATKNGDRDYFYENMNEVGETLTPYVKENFPQIERGDALELGVLMGYPGRKEHFMFWDGEKVIPQCHDYYDYDGGGAPLCFKTFTEFPFEYFSEVCWFPDTIYLDYDTFVDQIRNLKPTFVGNTEEYEEKEKEYDENNDDEYDVFITYEGVKYSNYMNGIRDAYDSAEAYIKDIQDGKSQHIMLVNSRNKIVNVNGDLVY